jgi:hypothetical protein
MHGVCDVSIGCSGWMLDVTLVLDVQAGCWIESSAKEHSPEYGQMVK